MEDSSQEPTLLGYQARDATAVRWGPVYDMEQACLADLDKFVFGSTPTECLQQLQVKFPADDPGLTRVVAYAHFGRGSAIHETIEVLDSERQYYEGTCAQEAAAIGQRCGHVRVNPDLVRDKRDEWLTAGFVVPKVGRYGWFEKVTLKYAPKHAKRLLKTAQTYERRRAISTTELVEFYVAMRNEITNIGVFLEHSGNSLDDIAPALLRAIRHFNWIFGKNAHRRLGAFRKFKKAWKERETQTVRTLRNDACTDATRIKWWLPNRRTLCNWMSEELLVRSVPVHTGKWHPLREMPNFEKFTDNKRKKNVAKKAAKKSVKKTAKKKAVKKTVKKTAKKTGKKAGKKAASKSAPGENSGPAPEEQASTSFNGILEDALARFEAAANGDFSDTDSADMAKSE